MNPMKPVMVRIDEALLEELDTYVTKMAIADRSKTIRLAVRQYLDKAQKAADYHAQLEVLKNR